MDTTSWFETIKVAPQTWLISEPGVVNSYLLVGRERALLFDSGTGIGDIGAEVTALTDRPILLVNSHTHFDHIGGNCGFDDIAVAREGAARLEEPVPIALLEGFLTQLERTRALQATYAELDQVAFHELAYNHFCRPYPPTFERESYAIAPSRATHLLTHGDVIDLGARRLQVLLAPGHSADSLCLYDTATGLLLTGDVLHNGHLYAHVGSFDLAAYRSTVACLSAYIHDRGIRWLLPGHFRSPLDAQRCSAVQDALEALANGSAARLPSRPQHDVLNAPVRQVYLGNVSVFLPPAQCA